MAYGIAMEDTVTRRSKDAASDFSLAALHLLLTRHAREWRVGACDLAITCVISGKWSEAASRNPLVIARDFHNTSGWAHTGLAALRVFAIRGRSKEQP
jgi:hypothetical protein